MSLTGDDLNYLVFRYLQESGFGHAAFTFASESGVVDLELEPEEVPVGALLSLLQKGMQYLELESHLADDGSLIPCSAPFSLLTPHKCSATAIHLRHSQPCVPNGPLAAVGVLEKETVVKPPVAVSAGEDVVMDGGRAGTTQAVTVVKEEAAAESGAVSAAADANKTPMRLRPPPTLAKQALMKQAMTESTKAEHVQPRSPPLKRQARPLSPRSGSPVPPARPTGAIVPPPRRRPTVEGDTEVVVRPPAKPLQPVPRRCLAFHVHTGEIFSLSFAPPLSLVGGASTGGMGPQGVRGRGWMLAAGSADGKVSVYHSDTRTLSKVNIATLSPPPNPDSDVTCLKWRPHVPGPSSHSHSALALGASGPVHVLACVTLSGNVRLLQ
ncbi:hypothetical protein KIPB_007213, partial [Kipferlia bialata]|eukprot:g7213.t1